MLVPMGTEHFNVPDIVWVKSFTSSGSWHTGPLGVTGFSVSCPSLLLQKQWLSSHQVSHQDESPTGNLPLLRNSPPCSCWKVLRRVKMVQVVLSHSLCVHVLVRLCSSMGNCWMAVCHLHDWMELVYYQESGNLCWSQALSFQMCLFLKQFFSPILKILWLMTRDDSGGILLDLFEHQHYVHLSRIQKMTLMMIPIDKAVWMMTDPRY